MTSASSRYQRWHGHYSVIFTSLVGEQPTMHLFDQAGKVGDKWKDYSMCGRQAEYWIPFRHAVRFGVKCSQCERAATLREAAA
jgi:hypothetical protein